MKVKILNSSGWYRDKVGEEIEIKETNYDILSDLRFGVRIGEWVYRKDCVITELPESFCVKRVSYSQKWEKYIDWLRNKYDRNLHGYIDIYYGVKDEYSFGKNKPFGIEMHIDDIIKHIDYMEDINKMDDDTPLAICNNMYKAGMKILIYLGSEFILTEDMLPLRCGIHNHDNVYTSNGDYCLYDNDTKKYAEIEADGDEVEEEFDMTTLEGRINYAKKHYPIGTEFLNHNGNYRKVTGPVRALFSTVDIIDVEAIDIDGDLMYPDLYTTEKGWVKIIKKAETVKEDKRGTQKLSRKGLKEIHSVACTTWKTNLENYSKRNTLEDFIELTNIEVDHMFKSCTKEQLPIVSKYLKQDDGSVDVTKFEGSIMDGRIEVISCRVHGEFENKSYWLSNDYNWEIKIDDRDQPCLIPTKKK